MTANREQDTSPDRLIGPRLEQFLEEPRPIIVGTTRSDGSVQQNPLWFDLSAEGYVRLNTTPGRHWLRHIQRDRRATFFVIDESNMFRWVQLLTELVDVDPEPAAEHVEQLAQRYTGHPYGWPRGPETRLAVRLRPTRVVGRDGNDSW